MRLTSTVFEDNGIIPVRYTCDGENISPPFAWSELPKGTRGFALFCDDPDAPSGVFHHWCVYNIPVFWQGIGEDCNGKTCNGGVTEAINSFGKAGYGGACPPKGGGPHHYRFRLEALNVATIHADPAATCEQIAALTQPHVVETAVLVGLFERK